MLDLGRIFTIKNIVVYLIIINLITFLAMFIDKKKAEKGKWRIKEATLLTLCLIGGSIGGFAGMYTFRHKTQKTRFFVGIPAMLILQIAVALYFSLTK